MSPRPLVLALTFFALGLTPVLLLADEPNPVGIPKGKNPGGGLGVYRIWYDKGEWHLRTSTDDSKGKKDKLLVFSGSVKSDAKMTVEGKALEKAGKTGDRIVPHADGKGFDFEFKTYNAVDFAIFKVAESGKKVTFNLKLDGEKAPLLRILIGEKGDHPDKSEFALPAHPTKPEK